MICDVIADCAGSISQAFLAVIYRARLTEHLGVVLVVAIGTQIVAIVLTDQIVGNSCVALLELEGQPLPDKLSS